MHAWSADESAACSLSVAADNLATRRPRASGRALGRAFGHA